MSSPPPLRLARFAIAFALAITAQAQTVVRVLHYNIHRDVGGTDSNVSSQPALAKVVNHLAPDVWAINELGGNSAGYNAATARSTLNTFINTRLTIFGPDPQENVNYYLYLGTLTDGYIVQAIVSRYPFLSTQTYSDAGGGFPVLRGLVSAHVNLPGPVELGVFTAHLKAFNSTTEASKRQAEAEADAATLQTWLAAHPGDGAVMTGDLNETEEPGDTDNWNGGAIGDTLPNGSVYHPVTTLREAGLADAGPVSIAGNRDTIDATSPDARFDYVLHRASHLTYLSGQVFDTKQHSAAQLAALNAASGTSFVAADSASASDHLPVLEVFLASPGAPYISSQSASGIDSTIAVLNAAINPNGFSTTWRIELGMTTAYGMTSFSQTMAALAANYPSVIAEVRGQGLMLAIEFHRQAVSSSFLLRFLSSQEDLAYVITGYLLNVHRIRIAPTLSDRFTLRLEPSALIEESEMCRFLAALEDVCSLLADNDALKLTRYFTAGLSVNGISCESARSDGKFSAFDATRFHIRQKLMPSAKVAWLCHFVDTGDFVSVEPPFAAMPLIEREQYLAHFVSRVSPVVMSAVDVRSVMGNSVRVYPILLPFTSSWIKHRIDERQLALPQALVQQGIDLASTLDCQMVALGQYTSIVTLNGTRLAPNGTGVTTGNSYAIALAIEAIESAQREVGREPRESVLVIAGAAGNIGRTCAEILAPHYRRTILIGTAKAGSWQRLQAFAGKIPNSVATADLSAAGEGNIVVAALNAVDAPLSSSHLAQNAIICDLSVPTSVRLAKARPDLFVIKGGIVSLPFGEDLEIVGFPLPRGQTYGCMAEAMLLGLEGVSDTAFTGSLTPKHIGRIGEMARRHGFKLADYKRQCVFGSDHG